MTLLFYELSNLLNYISKITKKQVGLAGWRKKSQKAQNIIILSKKYCIFF